MSKLPGVIILSPFYSPNIGGVETHLDDLVKALDKRMWKVFVQTYSPITTEIKWKREEYLESNIYIRRYRWFGKNLFHKLEKYPLLDFIYLSPYLLIRTFLFILRKRNEVSIIHAHGLNAAAVGVILSKLFHKRLIVSFHAIYEIDPNSITANISCWILNKCDHIFCLSDGNRKELINFGVMPNKLSDYRYWIDLGLFQPSNKVKTKAAIGLENNFTVLFVGRLIEKKGVNMLLDVAKQLPDINFVFVGDGPLREKLCQDELTICNVKYVGRVANTDLVPYYTAADLFCIPSLYEEGYGRVIMEAVACGTPVVGSRRGGIPQAVTEDVSVIVEPSAQTFAEAIQKLRSDTHSYKLLQSACRSFAEKHYSEKNIEELMTWYIPLS